MSGVKRVIGFAWLTLLAVIVTLHVYYKRPFADTVAFLALLALCQLFFKTLREQWRWYDLALRKGALWVSNRAVTWTLQVKVHSDSPIEDDAVDVVREALMSRWKESRVTPEHDGLHVTGPGLVDLRVHVLEHDGLYWLTIKSAPVRIGFRDSLRSIRRELFPVVEHITANVPSARRQQYSLEARFQGSNPYASVILNDLHATNADTVNVVLRRDQSTITVTRESVIASAESESEAIDCMGRVFGLSVSGALSAHHV
jgi:hypothetical protein